MKNILLALFIISAITISCEKQKFVPNHASVNIINAAVGSGTIKVNYFGREIKWASYTGTLGNISYGTNQILTIFNLNNERTPLIIVQSSDTLSTIFNQQVKIESDGMYSLFLTGQSPSYDAVFLKESNMAYNYPDSSIAIRFINLSPNSNPININLGSTPNINEFENLGYKQFTDFKKFPLKKNIPNGSVTFQIKDGRTNAVLASYTLPASPVSPYTTVSTTLSRFKSITLAIKGIAGVVSGANAYSVFPVAQY